MLSAYSAAVIAYIGDGFIVCRECAVKRSSVLSIEKADRGMTNASGLDSCSRYSLESAFPEGVWCEDCGTELVEPSEDEDG